MQQETIEKILSLDTDEVIGKYMELKRKGANLQGNCPFHNEKTPSFVVSPSRGIFKCFGCGVGGNAITFVMKHQSINFIEACKEIAKNHNIHFEIKEPTDEEKQKQNSRDEVFMVNQLAQNFFIESLQQNNKAKSYVKNRWNDEISNLFNIGYAPDDWHAFEKYATEKGYKKDVLLRAGLLSKSKDKIFDTFRNRIIFPINDKYGRVIGFSARALNNEDKPKYLNTCDTEVYSKSHTLYGFNLAHREIVKKENVHLVEGNPDVIKMQQIGVLNTVASCGTSLTLEHIKILKKYCKSITIIGDSDEAGKEAVIKNGKLLIENGLYCNVITLPEEFDEKGKAIKFDADNYFHNKNQFDEYAKEFIIDYVVYFAKIKTEKAKSTDGKTKLIDDIADLIVKLPEASHDILIEQVANYVKPKKAIQDKIKQIKKELNPNETKAESKIPDHVKLSDFEKYGFYDHQNCYYFDSSKGTFQGSNFVLEPLFHIDSVTNPKRLYRITNLFGYSKFIELDQKDLISLSGFQLKVESIGNFIWMAGISELIKLKSFLYAETLTATIIDQLGWNRDGFFAWSNGIYNNEYVEINEMGIVKNNEKHYYIPAFSKFYKDEHTLFMSEKQFIYKKGTITLNDYTQKIRNVFGDNAMFAFCFVIASLNRDIIFNSPSFGFFPILNLFGVSGSGKSELAKILIAFFGPQQQGINISSSTEASAANYISQTSNSIAVLDEYKNNFEPTKIEFLKGLWNAIGRSKMDMDKDKKKVTTAVDCAIVLAGQEMPTADIALFKRLIYLTFFKNVFTAKEEEMFNDLLNEVKQGLGHLTHEILSHREYFKKTFLNSYDKVSRDLRDELKDDYIDERILRNWLIILSSFHVIKDKIDISYSYLDLITSAITQIKYQNSETKTSNEIATFWRIIQYLDSDGLIHEGADYSLKVVNEIKFDTKKVEFIEPKKVLIIQQSRIIPLYRKMGRSMGENILPSDSIDYYLKNDNRFLGRKSSERFKQCDPKTGIQLVETNGTGKPIKKYKITSAYYFDYDKLGISLTHSRNDDEDTDETPF